MEFEYKSSVFQSVLRNLDKNKGRLSEIKPGDDIYTDSIKNKLLETIKELCLNKQELRMLYFLLLLNTDNIVFEDIDKDPDCCHLLGTLPKMSQHLFVTLVNGLKLEEFLYESILFMPTEYSIEAVKMYSNILKTRDPFELFKNIDYICRAIFIKLVIIDKEEGADLSTVKKKYLEIFMSSLDYYTSTNMENYKSWDENKLNYFSAMIMKSLCTIVKTCCKYYVDGNIEKESDHNIYNINIHKEVCDNTVCTNEEIDDVLNFCLKTLLSKFLTTCQGVNIFMWMAWVELEEYSVENMQSVVGNEVYHCLEYFKKDVIKNIVDPNFYSQLITVATSCSIKPFDEEDEIKAADYKTLLVNAKDSKKNQIKWLSALIEHEEFIPDLDSLNLINDKVHLLNQTDCQLLLNKCVDFVPLIVNSGDVEGYSKICCLFKHVVLKSLKNFHVDNNVVMLKSFVDKFGLVDILKTSEFDLQLTELFNKVIHQEHQTIEFYWDFIGVTIQSPEAVIKKILNESISSIEHGKLMLDLLNVVKPVCQFVKNDSSFLYMLIKDMMSNIEDYPQAEQENLLYLIKNLINKKLLEGDFFKSILMSLIHSFIENEKWETVALLLNFVQDFTDGTISQDNLTNQIPTIIVYLAQIIDLTRCTLSNFNIHSNSVCETAIHVLISILESVDICNEYDSNVNDWLKEELLKCSLIVQMHVESYLTKPIISNHLNHSNPDVYWLKIILCGEKHDLKFLKDLRKMSFLRTLMKLLPGYTLKEWKLMYSNLVLKNDHTNFCNVTLASIDGILLLIETINREISLNNGGKSIENGLSSNNKYCSTIASVNACISFIINNLMSIIQDSFVPYYKKMNLKQLSKIFFKICVIFREFPTIAENGNEWVHLKILQDIIEHSKDLIKNSSNVSKELNRFLAGILLIKNVKLRQTLSEQFKLELCDKNK